VTDVRRDPDGHHVLRDELPEVNRRVEAGSHGIHPAIVGRHLKHEQLQAVGIGSDRPLGTAAPTDPINDRVDLIKAQQGGAP
jgi:hypothetical protein